MKSWNVAIPNRVPVDKAIALAGRNALYARLRLKQLKLLDMLDRTGSVGRSAAEMHLTQSAATKMLQDVEDALGAPLFDRSARGLSATPLGRHVVRYAQQVIHQTDRMADELDELKAGGYGFLAIGTIMASVPDILPFALARFKELRPLSTVTLFANTSDELLLLLEQRRIDLALCRVTRAARSRLFDFEELFDEEYRLFVAVEHPAAVRRGANLADLLDQSWVVQPPGSPSREILDQTFVRAGLRQPRSRVETTSRFATLSLVRHAGMVGMLPSTILAEGLARGDFHALPIPVPRPATGYGLVTRRDEALSDDAEAFAAIVRARAASFPRSASPATRPG